MMTISPEYAAHFLEVYVKKTENAKFTGDRVRFLMLTLPFIVLALIAPGYFNILDILKIQYILLVYTLIYIVYTRYMS
jgi:hypothetical protein